MTKIYRRVFTFAFMLVMTYSGYCQSETMYYMGTVPQSYYLNPATQPECNFYLGLPIASSLQFGVYNSGISPNDIFWRDNSIDSVIHPLYSTEATNKFLAGFNEVEYLRFNMATNIASFGVRVNDMYFSFDATIKGNQYLSYPKDLLSLILKGNINGQVFDFSTLGIDFLNYTEFGLNISKNWGDQLSVGIRPKLLYGLATMTTKSADISLNTSTDEWILESSFEGNLAVTGMTIPVDEDGLIDPDGKFEIDSTIINDPGKNWKKAFGKNRGLGIDLGAHYRPIDNLQLSLSILDLGYIKWNENPQIVSQNGSFRFEGIENNLSDTINWNTNTILDTLKSNMKLSGSSEAFTTNLSPKIIAGGRFFLSQGFDVGLLYKSEFNKSKITQDLILLADWHPFTALSVSASYSLLGKSHSVFGLGIGLKLGPLNAYFISDYIPIYYDNLKLKDSSFNIPLPRDYYNFNFRMGLNLVFGCNKEKRLTQDKPLFNSTNWMF